METQSTIPLSNDIAQHAPCEEKPRPGRIDLCHDDPERHIDAKRRENVRFIMNKINPSSATPRKRLPRATLVIRHTTPIHRTRQRGSSTRASAKSGDSNSSDSDPSDPERHGLLTQTDLAAFLRISRKSLQNLYSSKPHELPPAISVPGARGPRWTVQAVQDWLANRPQHTPRSTPVAPRRKVGRPRIAALRSAGGAA